MKNIALAFVLLCCSAVCLRAETVPSPDARELAKKVADYVLANAADGKHYVQFFAEKELYHVSLHTESGGAFTLSIQRHLTTWSEKDLKTPADMLAKILMFGSPKTNIETYVWDNGANGILNGFQQHVKRDLSGFTREERDRGRWDRVQEYLYHDGKILEPHRSWFPPFKIKRQWQAATVAEQSSLQEEYFEMLQTIAKHYGIQ